MATADTWSTLRKIVQELEEETTRLTYAIRDGLWAKYPGMTIRALEVNAVHGKMAFHLWAEGDFDRDDVLSYLSSSWDLLIGEDEVGPISTGSDGRVKGRTGMFFSASRKLLGDDVR